MSAEVGVHQTDSVIELPQISRLMIIGASDTSIEFSLNIQNLGLFTHIHHVADIQQAIRLLGDYRFSVAVIDYEGDIDTISCSRLLSANDPSIRIILISSKFEVSDVIELKNKGSIHGYIPIPNSDILIHSIIIKEQSVFQLNRSLLKIIKNPPKFSKLRDRLNSRNGSMRTNNGDFRFAGIVVMKDTVVVYDHVIDEDIDVDPLLMSSYLSAVSIYGSSIFAMRSEHSLSYIDLEGISIFIKTIGSFQYLFLVEKRSNDHIDSIGGAINSMINRLQIKFQEFFNKSRVTPEEEEEFQKQLTHLMRLNTQDRTILDYEQKFNIANFNQPDEKMIEVFDEISSIYEIQDIIDEQNLFDYLKEDICHIIIFNDINHDLEYYQHLIQHAKQISPFTQIIVTISDLNSKIATKLLNLSIIDQVIFSGFDIDIYFKAIKHSIIKVKKIRKISNLDNLYDFFLSANRTEIVKTVLLQDETSVNNMTIPDFMGIIILRDKEKIFSEFFSEDNRANVDTDILVHFMNSLMDFSHEYSQKRQAVSSVKFGQSYLIVEKHFEFSFIYFIGDLDQSNIEYTQTFLSDYTLELYNEIINAFSVKHYSNTPNIYDELPNLVENISHHCQEMMIGLTIK